MSHAQVLSHPAWRTGPTGGRMPGRQACAWCGRAGERDSDAPEATVPIGTPEQAADAVVPLLAERDREACVTLCLTTRHHLIATELVSLGSLDHTFMAPREIYRLALGHNAAAVVVAHNHPSGDPTPSSDDLAVTRRLHRAGELVGITMLDHLVVAGLQWQSLARAGHM